MYNKLLEIKKELADRDIVHLPTPVIPPQINHFNNGVKKVLLVGGSCLAVYLMRKSELDLDLTKNFNIVEFFDPKKTCFINTRVSDDLNFRDKLIKLSILQLIK